MEPAAREPREAPAPLNGEGVHRVKATLEIESFGKKDQVEREVMAGLVAYLEETYPGRATLRVGRRAVALRADELDLRE